MRSLVCSIDNTDCIDEITGCTCEITGYTGQVLVAQVMFMIKGKTFEITGCGNDVVTVESNRGCIIDV